MAGAHATLAVGSSCVRPQIASASGGRVEVGSPHRHQQVWHMHCCHSYSRRCRKHENQATYSHQTVVAPTIGTVDAMCACATFSCNDTSCDANGVMSQWMVACASARCDSHSIQQRNCSNGITATSQGQCTLFAHIGIPGANSTINFHLRCPVTADLPDAVATYNHPHPVKPLSVATNTPSGGA